MIRGVDKARLRNAARKLDAARAAFPDPADRIEAAQEALDFLAMAVGLKPVLLLGRGLDATPWLRAVLQLAIDRGFHVVEGPCWEAEIALEGLPGWYAERTAAAISGMRAHYVCKARATARAVAAACRGGAPTVDEEARLLGYPPCCVAAHYRRARAWHGAWLAMLTRVAGGDEAAMRRLFDDNVRLEPDTDDESGALEAATTFRRAPFTSVNMCADCETAPDSSAMALAARYRALAETVAPELARVLAVAA